METVLAVAAVVESLMVVVSSLVELYLEWRDTTGRAIAKGALR